MMVRVAFEERLWVGVLRFGGRPWDSDVSSFRLPFFFLLRVIVSFRNEAAVQKMTSKAGTTVKYFSKLKSWARKLIPA